MQYKARSKRMRMQNLFLVAASLLIFFVALAFITIVIREAAAALTFFPVSMKLMM